MINQNRHEHKRLILLTNFLGNSNKTHQFLRFLFALTLASFSVLALLLFRKQYLVGIQFSPILILRKQIAIMPGIIVFLTFLICFLLFYFILSHSSKNFCPYSLVLAVLYTALLLIGKSYNDLGIWDLVISTKGALTSWGIFTGVLLIPVFYTLIHFFFHISQNAGENKLKYLVKADALIRRNPFLIFWAVIAICWIFYIIPLLPGTMTYDGAKQLNMFYGVIDLSNIHPVLSTWLMGTVHHLGCNLSGNNGGAFAVVLFQFVLCSCTFAYICKWIYAQKQYLFSLLALAFYSFLPVWPNFIQLVCKDTVYFAAYSMWFVSMLTFLQESYSSKSRNYFCCVLFSILTILLRNEGFYIVFPTALLILVNNKKNRSRILLYTVSLLSFFILWNTVVLPFLNITPSPEREKLSLPFQQTARYVMFHSTELSPQDVDTINKVLNYSKIVNYYNPDLADPVKGSMRENISSEDKSRFIQLWLSWFRKHPDTMIQAALAGTYGYFYPFYQSNVRVGLLFFNTEPLKEWNNYNPSYFFGAYGRNLMKDYTLRWRTIPGVSVLVSPGFYTWLSLFLLAFAIKNRRNRSFIPALIPFFNIGICFLSPVNGYLRYSLPLMAIIPPLMAWVCGRNKPVLQYPCSL